MDCIYIDPPYKTGARDWKYNNDYVDANDAWRHSKWLSFMEKRLRLAKRLLRPEDGVLIVTVGERVRGNRYRLKGRQGCRRQVCLGGDVSNQDRLE